MPGIPPRIRGVPRPDRVDSTRDVGIRPKLVPDVHQARRAASAFVAGTGVEPGLLK